MNTPSLSLRKYTQSDDWLLKESTKDPFLGDIVLSKKLSDVTMFVVADKTVGFAVPRKDSDGRYRTGPIYVLPQYRGKGYAGQFAQTYFKDRAGRAWIEETNTRSQKLFESVGFVRTTKSMLFEDEKLWEYIKQSGNSSMLQQFTISNEVISVDVSRQLGKLVQEQIAKMRKCYDDTKTVSDELLKELSEIVSITGLKVEFRTSPYIDAWMFSPTFWGHHGTAWNSWGIKLNVTSKEGLKYVGKVDLKNLTISGDLTKDIKFTSCIGYGFFQPGTGYTDEEITAVLLHEIGHGFNTMVTLGDYIYLNYMLADGIDVLLGNKRNEFNLEILDHTWVEKNLEKEQRELFVNNPSPASARRAILSLWQKAPRHYLFDNPTSAHRREEQMADMFATRLGYGRALATANDRMFKSFGVNPDERPTLVGDLFRLAAMIVFIPITLMWLLTVTGTNSMIIGDRYDPPKERLNKIRLDLITQLKNIKDRSLVPTIADDIAVIDKVLAEYHTGSTVFDAVAEFASPNLRKQRRLMTHEENLESLLNNDLFVTAQRFKGK